MTKENFFPFSGILYINDPMKYFILILTILIFSAPVTTMAAPIKSAQSSPSVVKVEDYLRSLITLKARFLQSSPYGQMVGTFYLKRPGRLRFEYDDPVKDFVVADRFFIYFYDSEMEEQSNVPIGQTLADFILRDDLRLSGDVRVTDIRRHDALLHITLVQTDDPEAGSLTLSFEENPTLKLKKWVVLDPTGAETRIELFQMESGIDLARSLFIYQDPKRGTEHYND